MISYCSFESLLKYNPISISFSFVKVGYNLVAFASESLGGIRYPNTVNSLFSSVIASVPLDSL
jgi:hypothetical protein